MVSILGADLLHLGGAGTSALMALAHRDLVRFFRCHFIGVLVLTGLVRGNFLNLATGALFIRGFLNTGDATSLRRTSQALLLMLLLILLSVLS